MIRPDVSVCSPMRQPSDGNQQPVPLHRLKDLVTGDWGLHPGCVAVLLTTW